MLQSLPIDLTDEQRKSQMKKSQLGHVVMFLSKPEVEDNRANRRIARVHPLSDRPPCCPRATSLEQANVNMHWTSGRLQDVCCYVGGLWPQELVNRWSEQIYGAHRDERETADLRERHAQMQEARTARKRAEQIASAAAEGVDTLVSHLDFLEQRQCRTARQAPCPSS